MLMVRASTLTTSVGRSESALPGPPASTASPSPECSPRRERRLIFLEHRVQYHRATACTLSSSAARDTRSAHRRDRTAATSSAGSGPRFRFVSFRGQRFEIQQHDAHAVSGRIAITSLERPMLPSALSIAARTAAPSRRFASSSRVHRARRKFPRCCHFHDPARVGRTTCQYAVGRDFAGERGSANVFGCGSHNFNLNDIPCFYGENSYLGRCQR